MGVGQGAVLLQHFGQPKIRQVRFVLLIQNHIARLKVSVENATLMRKMDRPRQRTDELSCSPRISHRLASQARAQVGPVHQAHAEIVLPLVLTYLVDRHDVRVREAGRSLSLGLEAFDQLRRCQRSRADEFHGDHPAQSDLPGFKDDAHAAPRNLLNQLVIAKVSERAEGGFGSAGCGVNPPGWLSREGEVGGLVSRCQSKGEKAIGAQAKRSVVGNLHATFGARLDRRHRYHCRDGKISDCYKESVDYRPSTATK